jgi:hypothetical protein
MILGLLVAVVPFLGFPSTLYKLFAFIAGLLIAAIAFRMTPSVKKDSATDGAAMPFVESKPIAEQPINNQNRIQ